MATIRDKVFAVCVSVVLLVVFAHWAYALATPDYEMNRRSLLEGRMLCEFPLLSAKTISAGEAQSSFEQYVADSIPVRNETLLANAGMQRSLIEIANTTFGYDTYPSFLGSRYLVSKSNQAIAEYPSSRSNETPEAIHAAFRSIGDKMRAHNYIRWQLALADRSRISLANPAHDLVAGVADYPYYASIISEELPESARFINLSNSSQEEYYQKYFRTDHHWQVTGSYEAYTKIIEGFDRTPIASGAISTVLESGFYGSEARSGLIEAYSDAVYDISAELPELVVEVDGKRKDASWLNERFTSNFEHYVKGDRHTNVYADYFHGDPGMISIQNERGSGTLLVIGDSYTNSVDYLFAASYAMVYVVDPRHLDKTLDEFLNEHKIDDAVFLLASNTAISSDMKRFLK